MWLKTKWPRVLHKKNRTSFFAQKIPPLTFFILAVNGLVFCALAFSPAAGAMIDYGAFNPARVGGGAIQDWTMWFTHLYLHGGALHVAMNMLLLLALGSAVERIIGSLRFFLLYHLCGVVAALAQYAAFPGSVALMVGASGAVIGLLGFFLVFQAHITAQRTGISGRALLLKQSAAIIGVMFVMGVLNIPDTGSGASIAWVAHVGGFLCGVFSARFFLRPRGPEN